MFYFIFIVSIERYSDRITPMLRFQRKYPFWGPQNQKKKWFSKISLCKNLRLLSSFSNSKASKKLLKTFPKQIRILGNNTRRCTKIGFEMFLKVNLFVLANNLKCSKKLYCLYLKYWVECSIFGHNWRPRCTLPH